MDVKSDKSVTLGSILFNGSTPYTLISPNISLSSSSGEALITMTAASDQTPQLIKSPLYLFDTVAVNIASASPLTLTGGISGPGGMRKLGAGTLVINCDSGNWHSDIEVEAGTLAGVYQRWMTPLPINPTLGSGNIRIHSGATLDLHLKNSGNAGSFNNNIRVSGHGVDGKGALRLGALGSVVTVAGAVTLDGPATISSESGGSGPAHLGDATTGAGSLSGTGPLVKAGGDFSKGFPGLLQLNVRSTHSGGTIINSGLLDIGLLGSLVGTGPITVNEGGMLRISRASGDDPATSSISPWSVTLKGGAVGLRGTMNPAEVLAADSTGGFLVYDAFDGILDLGQIPAGDNLRLGAFKSGSFSGSIIPHARTHTVRLGSPLKDDWNSTTLLVNSLIADVDGVPTIVEHAGGGTTVLNGANTYSGLTIINGGRLMPGVPGALGTSNGLSDATVVNTGGTLLIDDAYVLEQEIILLNGGTIASAGGDLRVPVVLQSGGTLKITQNAGEISGAGVLVLDKFTNLHVSNSYTGVTQVVGDVSLLHPHALGSSDSPTVVAGGWLSLYTSVEEPIIVESGYLGFQVADYRGAPMTLAGGTLTTRGIYQPHDPITINSPIILQGGTSSIGEQKEPLFIAGGTSGTGTLRLYEGSQGRVEITSRLDHEGDTLLDVRANVTVASPQHLKGRLVIAAGSLLLQRTLRTPGLAMTGGTLFLNRAEMIVDAESGSGLDVLAEIETYIRNDRNHVSDQPRIGVPHDIADAGAIAILNDRGDGTPIFEMFGDEPVDANSILVRYGWHGDTNLDGVIDADDYFRIDQGFLTRPNAPTYRDGDFNYDGVINADDYFMIDSAFLNQRKVALSAMVPEPGAVALMLMGAIVARRRRSRL